MHRLATIEAKKLEEAQVRFNRIDKNRNARLSVVELQVVCQLVGVEKPANVQTIIKRYDEDKDGKLNFGEFLKMITEVENNSMAPKDQIDVILRAFENSDLNKDGFLSRAELKAFIQKMGNVSDEHVTKLFDEADINKDGRIDTEEFIQVMRKNSH